MAALEEKIKRPKAAPPGEEVFRPSSQTPNVASANPLPTQSIQSLDTQRAEALVVESQKFQRIGQWEQALPYLEQAMTLLPQDPAVLYQYAFVLGRLQREAEALDVLDGLLASRTLDPAARLEVQKLANLLEQTQSNVKSIAPRPAAPDAVDFGNPVNLDIQSNQSGAALVDESGISPGAFLGIVSVEEVNQDADSKALRIAIKCRPDTKVDNRNAEVRVKFFEKNSSGDVLLTNSKARLEWISQPIDWKDDLPELVDAIYPLPGTKAANPDSKGSTFYGYTVGVYFNGELQDSRSEPGNLQGEYPLELFLTNK